MVERGAAIVTGSTSGIGLGVARALAGAGWNAMLNGFGEPEAIEAERVGLEWDFDVRAVHDGADMSEPDEIARLVAHAWADFGGIDVVVNNVGVQTLAPIEDFPVNRYDLLMAVNMSSAWHMTRLTIGETKARGWGRGVNVASAHGLVASPFKSVHVIAKHALIGLTKTVALEGAEHGASCNAICPSSVMTPLVERQIPQTARARGIAEAQVKRDVLLAAQPTREFTTVEQPGALAAFLCWDAAANLTGAALPVDGGWTAP